MAFFENVGKKISATGQNAVNKAKEVAEVSKYNSMISDEQNRINTNFYQIGKLYLDLHGKDYEPQFASMIQEITASQKKISEYKAQIQNIKGIIICEKCGAEVSKDSAFCNSCGAPMPKRVVVPDENSVVCANCGKVVKRGMKFCVSCGTPMPVVQNKAESESLVSNPDIKVCPSCGTKSTDLDDMFCDNCGTKLVLVSGSKNDQVAESDMQDSPEVPDEITKELKCPACGFTTTDPEVLFCVECGTKLV